LYAQMAGRATRPAAEIADKLGEEDSAVRRQLIAASSKPSCLIVDFVGNSGRHKLVSMVDILGGKDLDEDEEAARALVCKKCEDSKDGLDTAEELGKAREEIKRKKEELCRQRAFIKITAKYRTQSVDPFNLFDLPPIDPTTRSVLDRRTATFKQRQIVREKLGINPDKLRYSQIKNLLDTMFGRIERNMATLRQTRLLRRKGVYMPMSKREATETIGRIMQAG